MSPVHELLVGLYNTHIGTIIRRDGSISLTYTPAYYADPDATPLSLSMPLVLPTHKARVVSAYVRGLLPDSADVRARWARRFGVRDGDAISLLAHIGTDTAGAAIFATADHFDAAMAATGELVPITDRQIGDRLRHLRSDGTDWQDDDEHWSLAGAQGKFTLARTRDGWARATGNAASTHIIKPGIGQIDAQALTEHVTMRALSFAGVQIASSQYFEFAGEPAIVVDRFDRRHRSDQLVRVHQEDLCQAFGTVPEKKYPGDGGPDVRRISVLLRDQTTDDSNVRFARAVAANYLVGAPDAHAKNYSILLAGSAVTLAPLYDVATGLAATRLDGAWRFPKAAMAIGGENRFGQATRDNWAAFATTVAIDRDEIAAMVLDLADRLPDAFADVLRQLPDSDDVNLLRGLLPARIGEQAGLAQAALR